MTSDLVAGREPDWIAVLGDVGQRTHLIPWVSVAAAGRSRGQEVVLLQLGDFSVRGGAPMLKLARSLRQAGALILVVPGNHEDWPWIATLRLAGDGWLEDPALPADLRDRIRVLPRGYRWTWHGRTWVAVGGAVSVDRAVRAEWWPEEEVTAEDEARIVAAGRADVLVAHDVTAGVDMHLFPVAPGLKWAPGDLERARLHRERMRRITDALEPRLIMHAHYDMPRYSRPDLGWGSVEIISLADLGKRFGWVHFDVSTMELEVPA